MLQTGVTEPAGAIAFSPDGQFLASIGALGLTVKLWEVATGRELAAFSAKPPGNITSMGTALIFGPDGKSLFAYSGGILSQWDALTGQQLQRLKLSGDGVGQFTAVFSPDARWLAINTVEKRTLTVNDVSSGRQIQSLAYSDPADGRDEMPAMAFSPDGRTLAMCLISEDNRGRKSVQFVARDVANWQVTKTIKVAEKDASKDNEKAMRDLAKQGPKAILNGGAQLSAMSFRNAQPYRALRFSSDGRTLAMLTRDLISESGVGTNYTPFAGEVSVRFFDFAGGRELNNINVAAEARNQYRELSVSADTTFALSSDGRQFAATGNDSSIKVVDATGRVLTTLSGHSGEVMAVAFSGDGKLVASSGVDSTIRIWNVANAATATNATAESRAELVRTLGVSAGPITGAAFSEDGRTLSIAGSQSVSVWDLPNGTALRTISLSGTAPRDRSQLHEA
ncbi:MAG: WD40 repeat domain-containing protein, partial [Blastocatellia bacterium]